ncbi:MAG: agmatine deiminase family protein [Sulfurospirillaceae bacterium]|nr:agmatine deiminase family protein [Sulfurospirillaceae bacterium]
MSIRLPAEWEKQEFILLVFPDSRSDWKHSIDEIRLAYIQLINAIQKYQKCIILCRKKDEVSALLNSMENITLIEIETNDTWIRDFGVIGVYEDEKLKNYDFTFNAWGGKFDATKDNLVNTKLQELGLIDSPMQKIDLILEGGSIDTNGQGVLLSTENCIFNKNRNPHYTKDQIKKKLSELFGTKDMIILKHGGLEGDDTDSHIDTLARFIDQDTIAYVKCYDEQDSHFKELSLMEKELKQTGYDLLPLPLPSSHMFQDHRLPATYMNFIFINNALIVPTYHDKLDQEVLTKLKTHLPQLDVIGVDASIFIREHGSLHCASINYFCYNSKKKS